MPIMYSKVTVEPSVEPVDLDDVTKIHLKVDDTIEDDLIDIMIKGARQRVESLIASSLITQTRKITLDYFPLCDTIRIPYGPLQSIVSISYYDENDQAQSMDVANDIWVDTESGIPRIRVKESWPATMSNRPNAVTITYKAGFGNDGMSIPHDIREALLMLVAHFYENRQAVIVSGSSMGVLEVPFGVEFLLANHVREHNVTY